MKTTTKVCFPLAALAAAVALWGCATPAARIRANQAAFSQLSEEQQALIRKGQIALGFDKEMVKLALGEPDRIRTRTEPQGVTEIWRYTVVDMPDGTPLYGGWPHRPRGWEDPLYPCYYAWPQRREHDHIRVTFRAGRVVAIEENSP